MTIDNVTAGTLIDPAWGNAVADQLNDLPYIAHGVTSSSVGVRTVTFGVTFADPPTVMVGPSVVSSNQYGAHLGTVTTTTARVYVTMNDASAAASVPVHWVAFGTLA